MKKRSAASNTSKPLEGFTFLVEESLGRRVAEQLRSAGFDVVCQIESTRTGIPDEEVFKLASENRWVVLSKDSRTRYRTIERQAIADFRLAVFQLAHGNLTAQEMADAFIAARSLMGRILRSSPPPFVVGLNRHGKKTRFLSGSRLIEGKGGAGRHRTP
ncbi:MAG: DUF5615 family PIN-like protein [Candidatus Eisenbacteria bacterium]|nr:DUF5615 family PIN-like protein [Candidatus Eisenbacteria bacterium]